MSGFIGTKLTMNLGERSYDIILKNGALENLYQFARLDRRAGQDDTRHLLVPKGRNSRRNGEIAGSQHGRLLVFTLHPVRSICHGDMPSLPTPVCHHIG